MLVLAMGTSLPTTNVCHKMKSSISAADSISHGAAAPRRRTKQLHTALPFVVSLALAAIVLIAGLAAGALDSFLRNRAFSYIVCVVTGIVFLLPSIYLMLAGRFNFFHPLVYPVFTYLFPAFILGGLYYLAGSNTPWIMDLVSDPDYYISLSFIYILIGFIGLMVGFILPIGELSGKRLSRWLPSWRWSENESLGPGLTLLLIGVAMSFWAIGVGLGGYQMRETIAAEGGLVYALTIVRGLGSFILWWCYFRLKRKGPLAHIMLFILIFQAFLSALISGSRATILTAVIGVFAAFQFSGRRVRTRTMALFAILGLASIIIGFSLGTTYRDIKGSEDSISAGESLRFGIESVNYLTGQGILETVKNSLDLFMRRFETVTSLCVIVANYERLAPLEAQYGIDNSIWTATWTALIPRFIWPNKPLISDARSVAALYFEFPTNSFGLTVFGDLLRNFGPWGVPIGMAVLGVLLRILYVAFFQNGLHSVWRTASYFLLLSGINYEAFYGSILPNLIRLVIGLLLGGLLLHIFIAIKRKSMLSNVKS
jgi:oligosaccharide repeat unit polymerase